MDFGSNYQVPDQGSVRSSTIGQEVQLCPDPVRRSYRQQLFAFPVQHQGHYPPYGQQSPQGFRPDRQGSTRKA